MTGSAEETAKKVFGVSKMKYKETWWWNEAVQEGIWVSKKVGYSGS